jgi:NAD(P)-dependent dehydrogenase (short-subunit alcohol dehydrogenase family)
VVLNQASRSSDRANVEARYSTEVLRTMAELNGIRVLITGATSGLGTAMAAALVKAGAQVMVTGREQAQADAMARTLGSSAIACQLDVRSEWLASKQAAGLQDQRIVASEFEPASMVR